MKEHLIQFALLHPKRILWATLLLTLALGLQIPRIVVDTDPENMLPAEQPERIIHDRIKEQFNLYDLIVVGVVNTTHPEGVFNPKTLNNVRILSEQIKRIDGVISQELMSLATVDNITQEGPGTIRFNWMMNQEVVDQANAATIKRQTERLPMFMDTLVSRDGKALAIYVPIASKSASHRISTSIRDLTQTLVGDDQYHITGLPVAEDTFGVEMFIQMAISAPLAALTIFLLMWVFFRSFALITAPMLVAMASVIMTMGGLIGSGFTVHIMSSMIPIFLMPIAVVDSVHILSEFAETHKPGADVRESIRKVLRNLFQPMLFTSITSIAGFASLAFTPIPPVQVFGIFVAIGIALAFILTITFIPAYIVSLSADRIEALASRHHNHESKAMQKTMSAFYMLSARWSKLVIVLGLALAGVSVYGIQRIQINDNPVRWFKESHEIRIADRILNDHFAGTYDAYLVLKQDHTATIAEFMLKQQQLLESHPYLKDLTVENTSAEHFPKSISDTLSRVEDNAFDAAESEQDGFQQFIELLEVTQSNIKAFQSPELLQYVERLQGSLAESGLVGKSNALPDVVKTVYRELRGGSEENFRLPDTQNQVGQTLLSYQSSHRPNDLWHFVTADYDSAAIWIQLKSGDNKEMSRVVDSVAAFVAINPLPDNLSIEWGGLTYINVVWQDAMVNGMLNSLLGAFVMVFVMMALLFRSIIFGILAMIPLSLTIALIYGLIGIVGKDYDMPVAVLSSLTLGLSVDFAIHFLERCRAIFADKQNWPETLKEMFNEPGVAITRNAIVIAIGFLPLLAAPLVPYNTVGIFLASIMAASCIITLALLPAILQAANRILFRQTSQGDQS